MPLDYSALHGACAGLDVDDISTITPLVDVLDGYSKALAADVDLREQVGSNEPGIWHPLRRVWSSTTLAHNSSDEDEDERRVQLRKLCFSVARFTRNLVAAVPPNQNRAFENEPDIRALTKYYTSYASTQDAETFPATRMLVQTLSNVVTANEELMAAFWGLYLDLPQEELVLLRLLSVPDPRTAMSTFILVLNCLRESERRAELLTTKHNGTRLCISLLDRIASLATEDDSADASQAFEVGYDLFCVVIDQGLLPPLYRKMAVEDEVVTPHQTTLLKLLDSYLQPSQTHNMSFGSEALAELCSMLTAEFFALAIYAQQAIIRALGSNDARSTVSDNVPTPQSAAGGSAPNVPTDVPLLEEVNLMLPKVSEALILVAQCLISLTLYSEESVTSPGRSAPGRAKSDVMREGQFSHYVNASVSPNGLGSIECLIETLRLLDKFLPRIAFGKVAPPPVPVEDASARRGPPVAAAGSASESTRPSDPKGFAYLKRDLVRLLGILVSGRRAVQDRVRACGGIQVVLNLCVVDERNPYLREHAIFTLRNLLHENLENQALVNEIQPLREWDEDGMLQTRGGAA